MATREERRLIEGYESPIHQSLSTRILTWGVPRLWFILSLMGSIFAAFAIFATFQAWLAVVPLGLWGVGHVVMMWLTKRDPYWDAVFVWSFRYGNKYEAG
jgi:type IV secretory pathway TrbD component